MVPPPAGAKELLEILNQHSPRNQSDKNSH